MYQLASQNSTHILATIKSLTKINLQGLEGSKAKPQQKIAYSRPASETSLITIHFTDQTQYYCKQSGKLPTAEQQLLCSCYSTTGTPRPKLVITKYGNFTQNTPTGTTSVSISGPQEVTSTPSQY